MFFYYDYVWYAIILLSAGLGFLVQSHINNTYKKWSAVKGSSSETGATVARQMLDASGARSVGIGRVSGHLTDYFDPRDKSLHLSEENYDGNSVASIAVSCHEAGHAIQTEQGYFPGRLRTQIVPVVNVAQQAWGILFMLGFILGSYGMNYGAGFTNLAIVLFAFCVVFHLVTLPVEIDASRRAIAYLGESGTSVDKEGAKQVLIAAALTYVAAALMSIIQLAYLVSRSRRS